MLFGGIALIVVGFCVVSWIRDRERRSEIGKRLRDLGFAHDDSGFDAGVPEFEFFRGNPLLKYERNSVRWLATGELSGRPVRALEYRYATGYGRSTTYHDSLIVATDLPIPCGWIVLERKRWFTYHSPSEKPKPLPATFVELNRGFVAFYNKESDIGTILTARVRAMISLWPHKHWLQFRDGVLMLGVAGRASVQQIQQRLDALIEIADAIESQAGAYQQTSPPNGGPVRVR